MNDAQLVTFLANTDGLVAEAMKFLTRALDAIVEIETDPNGPDDAQLARCRQAIGQAKLDLRVLRPELRSVLKEVKLRLRPEVAEEESAEAPQ